eukprot:scaffold21214_cov101-Isochrysis_galbana.AAC.2
MRLFSGPPQDQCIACPPETRLCLDGSWGCTAVSAFASAREDDIDMFQSNWAHGQGGSVVLAASRRRGRLRLGRAGRHRRRTLFAGSDGLLTGAASPT